MGLCERMLNRFSTSPNFFNKILFSDETTLHLHGAVHFPVSLHYISKLFDCKKKRYRMTSKMSRFDTSRLFFMGLFEKQYVCK